MYVNEEGKDGQKVEIDRRPGESGERAEQQCSKAAKMGSGGASHPPKSDPSDE